MSVMEGVEHLLPVAYVIGLSQHFLQSVLNPSPETNRLLRLLRLTSQSGAGTG